MQDKRETITVYMEQVPKHYDGDHPTATIRYKAGEYEEAARLRSYIEQWRAEHV